MRRRVHYASWVVAAVSFLWLVVVFQYSIRRDRILKRLSNQFESYQKANDKRVCSLVLYIDAVSNSVSSVSTPIVMPSLLLDEKQEPPFEPRLVGRGQTKSRKSVFVYEDWEDSPGHISRRYVLRLPFDSHN